METTQLSGTRDYAGGEAIALRHARASLEGAFRRYGYSLIDPPILEHAGPFLDRSGEDIRRRMYIFSDPGGQEVCLRPELTIPACRAWLQSRGAETSARLAYMGPAFRYDPPGDAHYRQFYQAGVELIGGAARAAADAEILALSLEALEAGGVKSLAITMGDNVIIEAFIMGLPADDATKARLRRIASRPDAATRLAGLALAQGHGPSEQDELARLLTSIGSDRAETLLSEIFALVDLRHVGGRTPQEIVERLMTRTSQSSFEGISRELIEGIAALLKIGGTPAAALKAIAGHFKALGIRLGAGILDENAERLSLLAAYRGKADDVVFNVGMHRELGYYTGFVFEIHARSNRTIGHLVGGGRYDNLLQALGAGAPTPAVGFAIDVDRLLSATKAADAPAPVPDAVLIIAEGVRGDAVARAASALRAAGWNVETDFSQAGEQPAVQAAAKRKIPFAVLMDKDDARKRGVRIRRLTERAARAVPLVALADFVADAKR